MKRSPGQEATAEADRLRRLERTWQDEVGHALLEKPFEHPGSALVFERQFERIRTALGELGEGPLVEVGCGRGQLLGYLRQTALGKERLLVGIDVSVAVRGLPARGATPVCADGEFLPLSDASAAAIVYSGALHHIVDYRAALREAMRVLRPGGRLVVFEPASSAFNRIAHRVLDPIVFRTSVEYESPIDQYKKHAFREGLVTSELLACGATITQSRSDFLAYPLTGCYAGSLFTRSPGFMQGLLAVERAIDGTPLLGALARLLAWRFLIVAEKPRGAGPEPRGRRGAGSGTSLSDIVACPACKGELAETQGDALVCAGCRLVYRVADGVPLLLADEARPLPRTG